MLGLFYFNIPGTKPSGHSFTTYKLVLTTVTNNIVGRITNMFSWKNKLLNSTELKKQNKILNKKHTVEVSKLISKRLHSINDNTGHYVGGDVTIDDNPFTAEDRDNYAKKRAKQIKNKDPVEVQLPSTAIANARFDEDKGAIYITYVGDGGKEYVFKGNRKDWLNFMNAGSKGRYVQYVMKVQNQAPKSWY